MNTKKIKESILMTNERDNSFIATNAIYEFFAGLDGVDLTDVIPEQSLKFYTCMMDVDYSYKFDVTTCKKYRLSSRYDIMQDTSLATVIVDDMTKEEDEFIAKHIIENIEHYPDFLLDYTADGKPFLIIDRI